MFKFAFTQYVVYFSSIAYLSGNSNLESVILVTGIKKQNKKMLHQEKC